MWGRFEHSLDDKGRVIVPQKFREQLGDDFVIVTGPDHHIRVYPMSVWNVIEEQLVSASVHDEQNPDVLFLQRLYGNCEFVSSDQQNRLSIPRYMREWANLREGETAIVIGNGERLEIWSRNNWEALSEQFTEANAARASTGRRMAENGTPVAPVEPQGESVPNET
jgi:MraZ protein